MSKRTQWPLVGDVVWVGAAVPVGGSLLQDVRWPAISRAAADVWRVAVDERGEQAARQLFDEVARGTPGRKKGKGLRPEADSELMATYERGIRLGIPKDRVIRDVAAAADTMQGAYGASVEAIAKKLRRLVKARDIRSAESAAAQARCAKILWGDAGPPKTWWEGLLDDDPGPPHSGSPAAGISSDALPTGDVVAGALRRTTKA